MDLDAIFLSRLQFAFTLGFHILFPTLTLGVAPFLVLLEVLWLRSGKELYMRLYRFWAKLFGLAFGMGVVTGVVLSFEFGTNFALFSRATGNVLGPLFAYEVLMAFFLEAGFLPVMLLGWGRVGMRLHLFATCMVALGSVLSAFWILAANSWMHTPAGFTVVDGVFFPANWWQIVFSPSSLYRLSHMLTASFLTGAFVVAGVSAWRLLRRGDEETSRRAFSLATGGAVLLSAGQIGLGDLHGLQVQRDQPMKVAAMEALWETRPAAPLVVFALPDMNDETNRYALEIPYGTSLILKHDPQGIVLGLDQVAPDQRPYVPIVFFAFRLMVGIGFLLFAVAVTGLILRWRGVLYSRPWFLRLCVACSPLGLVAVIAGWVATETGRQPWVVQGMMTTTEAATPLPAGTVVFSLTLYFLLYAALLPVFLYFFARLVRKGPEQELPEHVRAMRRTAWSR
ncbi:MAG: cytochrome ubiquinol oxidase subunit I [Thiobacillus sp.]|jgi:cytochrome d ubiquinol oxidase subunit I|uniref:cytochrome ubiquinol oxidase subunit I n=1 Tax=Thiobacillus sp. TaxID=924 RepID=UPI002893B399|nr:cytochrome ubiquinol oxidase subunit I [Thiobacillus sp.]MDT3706536.1 cytochrome ubiquinol oxidase subunit I [Thiobacillus sp.]